MTELAELGINRVSLGPYVFRACLGRLSSILESLNKMESDVCFIDEALNGTDSEPYFDKEKEA